MTSVAAVAPAKVIATLPTSLHHSLRRLADGPRPRGPQREVCPLSRAVMLQPLSAPLQNGIRFLPGPIPAALSACLAAHFPSTPLAYGAGRTTGLPRSADVPEWVRSCLDAGGSTSAPEEFEAPGPDHAPFGPSGSAACACSCVTAPPMLYLGWPYHSILAPDHPCCWQ
jgi:hypothetical protein